jgi:LysM repeat protein
MLKDLVKIANKLDRIGLTKEADILDNFVKKLAQHMEDKERKPVVVGVTIREGDTLYELTKEHSAPVGKDLDDNMKLNPGLDPKMIKPGDYIKIWGSTESEGLNR